MTRIHTFEPRRAPQVAGSSLTIAAAALGPATGLISVSLTRAHSSLSGDSVGNHSPRKM